MAVISSGTLTSKISSTASTPTVNYAVTYNITPSGYADNEVAINLTFKSWLNSSTSKLGTGIKLTAFVRVNDEYYERFFEPVVLKSTTDVWNGTDTHSASITIYTTHDSLAQIEFYVSRTGSTYSGTAGILGSESSPKSYTITVPSVNFYVRYSVSGDIPPGYTAPRTKIIVWGTTFTPASIPTVDGYTFAGWYLNGNIVTSIKITNDVTLTGVWTATDRYVYINVGGIWKKAIPYVNISGAWKKANAIYVCVNGAWKSN